MLARQLSEVSKTAIRAIVEDLVHQKLDLLALDGRIGRLTIPELSRAISDYGRTLVPLPDTAFELIDVYPITGRDGHVAVDVPLWTKEEGRSDLTLSLLIIERDGAAMVQISDLHVL